MKKRNYAVAMLPCLYASMVLANGESQEVQKITSLTELKESIAADDEIELMEQGVKKELDITPSVLVEYASKQQQFANISKKRLEKAFTLKQLLEPDGYKKLSGMLQEKVITDLAHEHKRTPGIDEGEEPLYQELTIALLQVFGERMEDKYEGKKGEVSTLLVQALKKDQTLTRDRVIGLVVTALVTIAGAAWGTTCETTG